MSQSHIVSKLFILALICAGCQDKAPSDDNRGQKVASVGNSHLYKSEVETIISDEADTADSLALATGYVEQWIRRNVLLSEAEKSFESTADLQKLIADYRSSLLINNYEQIYVSERLDTTISEDQIERIYSEQQDNFALAESIYKVNVALVPASAKGLDKFYSQWKKDDPSLVKTYLDDNATFYYYGNDWITLPQLRSMVPDDVFDEKSYKLRKVLQKNSGGVEYFVKILSKKDKGSAPPLDYVKDKLVEILLQQRKKDLLANLESDLYKKALSSNKIKVYKK